MLSPGSRRTCATTRARSTSTLDDVVGLGPVQRRGRQDAQPVPRLPDVPRAAWAATRARRSCSRVRPAPARPTWPRPWRAKPACPFLFVSSTAFQSMYYGQTGRKIRNYFKELRKAAREEGGAIGFIEEIDAIAGARSGMRSNAAPARASTAREVDRSTSSEGISRRRQRAADPAAVVRHADRRRARARAGASTGSTAGCPAHRRIAEEAADAVEHPGDRRDQPRRRPRPRAAAPGPLRPLDPLRPAEPIGPARDHRLLPRQEGARARARQGRAARRARGDDLRLHAGDDRAPLRRGARVGAARRPRRRWTGATCSRRR